MTWTRRSFLKASSASLLAASLPRGLFAFGHASEFRDLRRGVGIYLNRGGTIGWLVTSDGAVLVDSQYADTAPHCLSGIRERTARPVQLLVNTHHHYDHTGGNIVLREHVRRIVAHARVPELQRRDAAAGNQNATDTHVDTTFDTAWSQQVADETVHARHYGAAHTSGDCVVHFERANVVHMGDLVFNRCFPFVDRRSGASVQGWVSLLERVTAEQPADAIYIFGHAGGDFPLTGARADVLVQRDFLSACLDHARRAIAAGRSRQEAISLTELPGFTHFTSIADFLPLAQPLGAAYDELSAAQG